MAATEGLFHPSLGREPLRLHNAQTSLMFHRHHTTRKRIRNDRFGLGLWRGPERLADHLRKDYRIFAHSERFYGGARLYKPVYRYVYPTPMKEIFHVYPTPMKKIIPTRAWVLPWRGQATARRHSTVTRHLNGCSRSQHIHGHERSRPGRGRRKCFLVCRQVEKAIHRN